jgi:hypothetical protein
MTDSGLPLDAYLVVDNNAVVGLSEFYCDAHKELAFEAMIEASCQDIAKAFNALRRFAIGEKVFSTKCVCNEFKPEKSSIAERRDYDKKHCENLKANVNAEVEAVDVNMKAIEKLRCMCSTPKKFGEKLSRLSEEDLSLVILALGIINETNCRVYILTDEEDLRSYISWLKHKPEAKGICTNVHLLEGLHSMIYFDSAHRQCAFTTVQIYEMFVHHQQQQLKRMVLAGTTKLEMIEYTYEEIKQAIRESGEIKKRNMAGAV